MLVRQKTLKLTGVEGKVKWLTSNKKVATVSAKGGVKAVKAGTAKITAKVRKKKYTCKITVKAVKKATVKKNTKKAVSKSSAPQASTSAASSQTSPSATKQNNRTSLNTSAVSASLSAASTNSTPTDTSEANTESTEASESTDYLTTDITLNNDTRIVTKKDTNVVDLEEGKQYIDISKDFANVGDLFNYDVAEVKYYKYVQVHFNGHVYLTDGHNYLSGYDDHYHYEKYIEIVKVLS